MLTGTLGGNYKISIAAGATVKLQDVTINGTNSYSYLWAGINCLGDATIILKVANIVRGFYHYPGIHVPEGSTLTIKGSGSLDASSNGWGAGIGDGKEVNCGNIVIEGGTIYAIGGIQARHRRRVWRLLWQHYHHQWCDQGHRHHGLAWLQHRCGQPWFLRHCHYRRR